MTQRECELIDRLTDMLERMHLDDYLEYVSNRRRMLFSNFIYGMMRGLGFAIGFTVLGALTVVILKNLVSENMPVIGDFVAEVIHAIEARM